MSTQAFTPVGNTVILTAAETAPTPVQAVSKTLGGGQYRILNTGITTVFLGYGSTPSAATENAQFVTSTAPSIPLLPGTDKIITFVPNAYFTAVASSNTVVFITPGDGL